jgi:hypothetical protein
LLHAFCCYTLCDLTCQAVHVHLLVLFTINHKQWIQESSNLYFINSLLSVTQFTHMAPSSLKDCRPINILWRNDYRFLWLAICVNICWTRCVCTTSVYVQQACMYSKCVCTPKVYVLKVCMYLNWFALQLYMYSKCVFNQSAYLPKVCIYSECVCTPNVYVFQVCMYSNCVCTQIVYVSKCVCTQSVYVLKVCMYSKCVCTQTVYVLHLCLHSKCVYTQRVYVFKLCMYSKCFFTKIFIYLNCVCTQSVYVVKLRTYLNYACTPSYLYSKCVCTTTVYVLQTSGNNTHPSVPVLFPTVKPPGLHSHPLTVTSYKSSYTYYFTSDIYFIYSPFWNTVSSSVIDRTGYQSLHTLSQAPFPWIMQS